MTNVKNNLFFGASIFTLIIIVAVGVSFNVIATSILTTVITLSIGIILLLLRYPQKTLRSLSFFLVLSIFLVPSINIGGAGLRLDDYIAIFFTLGIVIVTFKQDSYTLPSMVKWLAIYLIYSSLITIAHLIFDDLEPFLLLFFIKEIQYFVYFIVFYYLAKQDNEFQKTISTAFVVVMVPTIMWGLYQLLTSNTTGDYGIGIISISAPSHSGIVMFISSVFMYYLSLSSEKKLNSFLLLLLSITSGILTFATGSRTAISTLIGIVIVYLLISLFRKWNFKKSLVTIYLSLLVIPISYLLVGDLLQSILERFSRFGSGATIRANFWQDFLSYSDTLGKIFGNGKGFMQEVVGTLTLKADSQYVRLILEVGVVGLILWTLMISSIIIYSIVNFKYAYNDALFLLLLTVSFIVIGITQEGYLVTLQGSLYWMLTGFFIGNIVRIRKRIA